MKEENLSQKWWNRRFEPNTFITNTYFKQTYDELVTLEAKIEELEYLLSLKNNYIEPRYALEIRLQVHRKELKQLKEKHKL